MMPRQLERGAPVTPKDLLHSWMARSETSDPASTSFIVIPAREQMAVPCVPVAAKRRASVAPLVRRVGSAGEAAQPRFRRRGVAAQRSTPGADERSGPTILGTGGEEGVRRRCMPIAIEVVGRRCLDDAAGHTSR